jgi:hypothetical protein
MLAGALVACASPGSIVPNENTVVDLRAKLGPPTDIRFDAAGNEYWEYARGPQGTETYLFQIGKDNRVVSANQLIKQSQVDRIIRGQSTKAEVRHLLGRPSDERFFRTGTVWEWRAMINVTPGFYALGFDGNGVVQEVMVLPDTRTDGGDKSDKGGK